MILFDPQLLATLNTWQRHLIHPRLPPLRGPRARPRQPPRVSQVLLMQSTCSLRTPPSERRVRWLRCGDPGSRGSPETREGPAHVAKHSLVGASKGTGETAAEGRGHCWALFSSPASCKCATLPSPRAPALPSPPTRSFPVPFPAPRVAQVLVMTVYLQSVYSRRRMSVEAAEGRFAPL